MTDGSARQTGYTMRLGSAILMQKHSVGWFARLATTVPTAY